MGRRPHPTLSGPELRDAVLALAEARFCALTRLKWSEVKGKIEELVAQHWKELDRELAISNGERKAAAALLGALDAAIQYSARQDDRFAAWVRSTVVPIVECDHVLKGLGFRFRKDHGSKITELVEAIDGLDCFNFIGLGREASDEEIACIVILRAKTLPAGWLRRRFRDEHGRARMIRDLPPQSVISNVRKAVAKARIAHGQPYAVRTFFGAALDDVAASREKSKELGFGPSVVSRVS